jgi:FkbM family methyltransferase
MTSHSESPPKSFRRRALEGAWRAIPRRLSVLKAMAAMPATLKSHLLWRIGDAGLSLTPSAQEATFLTNFGADAPRVRVPGRVGSNYLFMRAARTMHEQAAIDLCAKLLPDCNAFVDIGAHLGLYMWPLAKHLRDDCPGYYVEPNAELFALLERNVAESGVPFQGLQAAIGEMDGEVDFFLDRTDWSMSTLVDGFAPAHDHVRTRVRSLRFETFAREVGLRHALVKADIECAEDVVVAGIAAAPGAVRYFVCEVLEPALRSGFVQEVEVRLRARALAISDDGLVPIERVPEVASQVRNWLFAVEPGPSFGDLLANGMLPPR